MDKDPCDRISYQLQVGDWTQLPIVTSSLYWRHNERDDVSNHQLHDCLLKHLFRHRSKEKSKIRATGLCVGNSPVTGEFLAQIASNSDNVSIWWRHHGCTLTFNQTYDCMLIHILTLLCRGYHRVKLFIFILYFTESARMLLQTIDTQL